MASILFSVMVLSPVMITTSSQVQAQTQNSPQTEADRLLEEGRQQYFSGQYAAAKASWEKALAIYRAIHNQNKEGWVLEYLGLNYFASSQYDNAVTVYDQALSIFRKLKDRNGAAQALKDMGQAYAFKFEYAKAIKLYQQALPIFREVKDRNQEALTLQFLGSTYRSLAEYDQALSFYQQSLPIFRKLNNPWGEAYTLKDLGAISFSRSQYDQALSFYQQALPIFRSPKIKDPNAEAYTLVDMGLTYTALLQYDQAISLYKQSLSIFRRIGDRKGESHALMNLGNIYRSQSQLNQAIILYQNALSISREVKDLEGEGSILSSIGQLLKEQNKPELSIIFYKQSVEVRETIRKRNTTLPTNLQKSYAQSVAITYRRLADLLLEQDRVLEAQQILDLLKVQELDDYLRNVRGTDQTIEFRRAEQEILAKYNELQKSAIEIGSELANLRKLDGKSALNPTQQQRLTQLVKLETDINTQFIAFVDSPEIKNLAAKLQQSTANETINLPDVRKLKDKLERLDAVLLYPLILNDRLELVLSVPGSPPLRRTVNVKREELNRTIADFRSALGSRDSNAQALAEKLYGWLIQPIEADLKQAKPKTILYAPDGQLRYIPLAALHDGKQWLVERYRINNITALAVSDLVTPPHKDQQILAAAFGDNQITIPVDNQSFKFAGLPFAQKEVQSLVSKRPGTVSLFGPDFSLTTLQTRMNSFNIVHLATHGKFLIGNPKKSFLVMGNGDRLSLDSIQDSSLDNIDLVVLSACETGVGLTGKDEDGVEVLGIGYQFQRGGAKAAISSLWSINDGSTQTLMTIFYGLLQQGVPKAEALQQAQIALINGDFTAGGKLRSNFVIETAPGQTPISTNLKYPFYWAPFILIGNGL
jgi:CHAT domain-containing protein